MKLTWLGHSCFRLESGSFSLLIDPYRDVPGLNDIRTEANAVYCSHRHFDHAYVKGVKVIHGGENPFKVSEIHSFHDDMQGAVRGENTIRRFDAEGFSIVHMGDLGHVLDDKACEKIRGCDVLLIPIGGTYTIGPELAMKTASRISPRIITPMHYREGKKGFEELCTVDEFASLYPGDFVERSESSSLIPGENMKSRLLILKMP